MLDWVLNMPLYMIRIFTKRIFPSRLLLIKTSPTLNSRFFFRREINRDIAHTSFRVVFKKLILTP